MPDDIAVSGISSQGPYVKDFCPVLYCLRKQCLEWEEGICEIIDSVVRRPPLNSSIHEKSTAFGQLCPTGPATIHRAHPSSFHCLDLWSHDVGLQPAYPWLWDRTRLQFLFVLIRKETNHRAYFVSYKGLFSEKANGIFPSEESEWDWDLHDLCQMLLRTVLWLFQVSKYGSREQAWDVSKNVNIHWPQWHLPNIHPPCFFVIFQHHHNMGT